MRTNLALVPRGILTSPMVAKIENFEHRLSAELHVRLSDDGDPTGIIDVIVKNGEGQEQYGKECPDMKSALGCALIGLGLHPETW